ncbi:hypothetical protein D3C87_2044410 [compost metagenome]
MAVLLIWIILGRFNKTINSRSIYDESPFDGDDFDGDGFGASFFPLQQQRIA